MIPPRRDLDDEHTRLLTYEQAHAASVERLDAVASVSAGIFGLIAGPNVSSAIDPAGPINPMGTAQLTADRLTDDAADDLADELSYRAALAALSGVVQRSLRDFLS